MGEKQGQPMPFVCVHGDPRCEDDPCPWGIAKTLCNAPADHPIRATGEDSPANEGEGSS